MKKCHLVMREEGEYDDYELVPVKVFLSKPNAKKFIKGAEADYQRLLKDARKLHDKHRVEMDKTGLTAAALKTLVHDPEWNKLLRRHDREFEKLCKTFKYEKLGRYDIGVVSRMAKYLIWTIPME